LGQNEVNHNLHDYALIKGVVKLINTWKMQDSSHMGLGTCVCAEIISAATL